MILRGQISGRLDVTVAHYGVHHPTKLILMLPRLDDARAHLGTGFTGRASIAAQHFDVQVDAI
jgi:hypothetical protein